MSSTKVAVVTGASRGAGKGIALALGAAGYAVYATGRTAGDAKHPLGGSVDATAASIVERGGEAAGVVCDHADDAQVAALFERVREERGRLDILVNNVTAIPRELASPKPFWEKSLSMTALLDVGLRSHYVATHAAAPLLIETGGGLVAMTSSYGGRCYMHGPAYGAGKAGIDKMAMDMGIELSPHDVAVVSLWLGFVRTERNEPLFQMPGAEEGPYGPFLKEHETPEFIGRTIAALHADEGRMTRNGRVLVLAELAAELGVTEEGGRAPGSHRGMLGAPPEPQGAVVR